MYNIGKTMRSNYKITSFLDRASKVAYVSPSHHLITLAVDFIRIYSKFHTDISHKLMAFTPWNDFNFFKKLIIDRKKDEN